MSPSPRIRLLVSESEFQAWLANSAPGQTLEYHRGVLSADRSPFGSRLPAGDREQLDRIATIALDLATVGRVHLLQRRHGDGDYSYLVVMRGRGRKAASPRLAAVTS